VSDGEALALVVALVWLASRTVGPTGLTWPVPVWVAGERRHRPVVSSDYQGGRHRGVDILYRDGAVYTAPEGTPILAASSGTVERVVQSPRGIGVLIDHGDRTFKTFYQHLESVMVSRGERVAAGQQIGVMGIDPLDAQRVRHLHFEVWGWATNSAIDPVKEMAQWKMVAWIP
jgi:murein DD-endopeptidase MepM/ murein hydrolase activator NlpD